MSEKEKTPEKTPEKKWNLLVWNEKGQWYTSENQPTPQQKSEWRERKREAKRLLDEMMRLWAYNIEDLKKYAKNPKLMVKDLIVAKRAINVLTKDKFLLDYLDRHVPKAPQQLTWEDWQPIKVNFYIPDNERDGDNDKATDLISGEVSEE